MLLFTSRASKSKTEDVTDDLSTLRFKSLHDKFTREYFRLQQWNNRLLQLTEGLNSGKTHTKTETHTYTPKHTGLDGRQREECTIGYQSITRLLVKVSGTSAELIIDLEPDVSDYQRKVLKCSGRLHLISDQHTSADGKFTLPANSQTSSRPNPDVLLHYGGDRSPIKTE